MTDLTIIAMNQELQAIDWNARMENMDTTASFNFLIDNINLAINHHCPEKNITLSKKNLIREPWMTSGLINSSRKVNRLYKDCYLLDKTHPKYVKFLNYRNLFNKTKRTAKIKYYETAINESKNDSTQTWRILNKLIGKINNKQEITSFFKVNGTLIEDKNVISNGFCNFFSDVGPNLASKIPNSNHPPSYYLHGNHSDSIFLTPTTATELSQIIKKLRSKKSAGIDGISNDLIKKLANSISEPLSIAINKSMEAGYVPDTLKVAKIIPVYKSKDKQVFNNYRPISLLSNISKILEKVIHKRIYSFLTSKNILYQSQYGFRGNHSTNLAIAEFLANIYNGFEKQKFTLALFLDLSKAFDTIDHTILLNKLNYYGIRGVALKWMTSYLTGSKQFVDFKGVHSTQQNVTCGVPQGLVLLFICYT